MTTRGEKVGRLVGIVVVVLLGLSVRVIGSARAELAAAREVDTRGDHAAAIAHYRRAAESYAPFSPYPEEALSRLAEIGQDAEGQGDTQLALAAWRAVRAATLGARSFYVPHEARLREADHHLAALMARLPPAPVDARRSVEEREAAHLALLEADAGAAPLPSLIALVGLATWIASAYFFAVRAFGDDDKWIAREARRWGLLFSLGLGLFVIGLWLA